MKKRIIVFLVLGFLGSGCVGIEQPPASSLSPTKTSLMVEESYDKTWKAAMSVLSEAQICEGCFFEIATADKAIGIISASSTREHQVKGNINIKVEPVNDKRTNITVLASVSEYKYWGNLYGARFKERWENIDANFSATIAEQISFVATGSSGKADSDIFVKAVIDKTKIRKGEEVTLEYHLYTRYETRHEGFSKDFGVENEIVKPAHVRSSYFGISPVWDTAKNMAKIVSVREDDPASDGLYSDDFIKTLDGQEIKNFDHLMLLLGSQTENKAVKFSIVRAGKELEVFIVPLLNPLKNNEVISFGFESKLDKVHNQLQVTKVDPGFSAGKQGLKVGDTIEVIDKTRINSKNDMMKIINSIQQDQPYEFSIVRDGKERRLTIIPEKKKSRIMALDVPMEREIKREIARIGGKKFVAAIVRKVKLRFDEPGEFIINPGDIKVTTRWGGVGAAYPRILDTQPIKIIVTEN